ncbi:MAG: YdeI/OmpD-associated family protein [Vicingaceae bacterium]
MAQGTESYCPTSRDDWRKWLEKHHQSEEAVWLIYYKASSPNPSLSWSEAVDEALCFGWIDSTKKTIDEERYMQYFSKRKPKSHWSKINKEKVAQLIRNKQMTKAGFDSIEKAKQNGSWNALDASEALEVPNDLKEALAKHQGATEFYEGLSKSAKKILLHWVISAKRIETRQKRIVEIAENASKNKKPKGFR